MKSAFIGIDVSKEKLDAVVFKDGAIVKGSEQVHPNTEAGITKMVNQLKTQYSLVQMWFCFEHTGSYSMPLRVTLEKLG